MKEIVILKEIEVGGLRSYEQDSKFKAITYENRNVLVDVGGALNTQEIVNFVTTAELKNGMVILVDDVYYRIHSNSTYSFSGLKKYSAVRIDDV